ncbi:MAG: RNA polymerase sigma factor, partial [Gemmatimonadales bacterium]
APSIRHLAPAPVFKPPAPVWRPITVATTILSLSQAGLSRAPRHPAPLPELNALALSAAAGNREAFAELYRRTVGRVYALCLRLSGDPVRAGELTQDVYIRVWEKLGGFRAESAFTTWLHRLTVNVVMSESRREMRRERHTVSGAMELLPAKPAPPGLTLDLERALPLLPDGAREVFVLHEIEGYRHEEIAGLTGIAVGTSKAQLFRARRLLREMLER